VSQTAELSRVQANIGELVERFVLDRWQAGQPRFHIQDLHDYIATRTQIAPASPDRILRQLRLEGKFDYKVVSRSDSCYEITAINPGPRGKPARTVATKRNPKQEGTSYFDCIPQAGPCPIGCNQCFFNRPGAYYVPMDQLPLVPTPKEVGDGIVRMNCGNDSNNQRDLVIDTAKQYQRYFFNTSIPRFDFPGPVVLTANPTEEDESRYAWPIWHGDNWYSPAANLMFVRLRTSATNLGLVDKAVAAWTAAQVPVVITFMAYYDHEPHVPADLIFKGPCYEWRVRHINPYWCPTKDFVRWVMSRYAQNRLVSMCSSVSSAYCRDCRNCETHYLQTMKRLRGE
jgi:hypothetical protein